MGQSSIVGAERKSLPGGMGEGRESTVDLRRAGLGLTTWFACTGKSHLIGREKENILKLCKLSLYAYSCI